LRKVERVLERGEHASSLLQTGLAIAESILKVGFKVGSAVPLLGPTCTVAMDILAEVRANADKADDVIEAGRRVVDTLKMLEVMAANMHLLGAAERRDLESLMGELQAMLFDVKDLVCSFGKSGWFKRAMQLGKHAKTLKKLDARIRGALVLATNLYNFAQDAAAARKQEELMELVQERFYALEEAVESKIKERTTGCKTEEEAVAELGKDAAALSEVAQRAGIKEEVMLAELREFGVEVREQYVQLKASLDKVGTSVQKIDAGVDDVRDQLGELKQMVGAMHLGQGAPSSPSAGGLSQSAGPILQPSQVAAMSLGEQPTRQPSMAEYPNLSLDRYEMQRFFHGINTRVPGLQLVHEWPYIFVVDKFLSDSECDELVKKMIFSSEQKNSGSDAHGGAPQRDADTRTSMSVVARNTEVAGIRRRLAGLANVDVRQLQPTKLTRYDTGQHFAEHTDATFSKKNLERFREWRDNIDAGNVSGPRPRDDRFVTIFVYLNDVTEGGRTRFHSFGSSPDLYATVLPALAEHLPVEERMAAWSDIGASEVQREAAPAAAAPRGGSLDVIPVKGRAVLHFPTARRELACYPDYNAEHEGEEVIDPKFILQQFIWSTAVDPSNGALDEPVRTLFKELLEAASGAPLSSTVL